MNQEVIKATASVRHQFAKMIDAYSLDQLNQIPQGFNNNLIWNIAHAISVQQMIVYGLAGQEYVLDKTQVLTFKRGTKPEKYYDQAFVDMIKDQLHTTIQDLKSDIASTSKFDNYVTPFTAASGYEVHDLTSALTFNLFHESMHFGHMQRIVMFLK